MPFVTLAHRENPDLNVPGDRCYLYYEEMMRVWRANPRWTTVDQIASEFIKDPHIRAALLAFMVFFALHVMPYEEEKRKENGDV